MKNSKTLLTLFLVLNTAIGSFAQQSVAGSGGESSGSGGTASYTIGQVFFTTISGDYSFVAQGVQQAYEISVTSINNLRDINLEIIAYPNPTKGDLWLKVESFLGQTISYQIYNQNGKLLKSEKIIDAETNISLSNYSVSTYFLRIISDTKELKTFKIIKN